MYAAPKFMKSGAVQTTEHGTTGGQKKKQVTANAVEGMSVFDQLLTATAYEHRLHGAMSSKTDGMSPKTHGSNGMTPKGREASGSQRPFDIGFDAGSKNVTVENQHFSGAQPAMPKQSKTGISVASPTFERTVNHYGLENTGNQKFVVGPQASREFHREPAASRHSLMSSDSLSQSQQILHAFIPSHQTKDIQLPGRSDAEGEPYNERYGSTQRDAFKPVPHTQSLSTQAHLPIAQQSSMADPIVTVAATSAHTRSASSYSTLVKAPSSTEEGVQVPQRAQDRNSVQFSVTDATGPSLWGVSNAPVVDQSPVVVTGPTIDLSTSQVYGNLAQLVQGQVNQNLRTLHVHVKPEGMGDMVISVTKETSGIQVHVDSAQAQTFEWMQHSHDAVVDALQSAGLDVSSLQLTFGQSDSFSQSNSGQPTHEQNEGQSPRDSGSGGNMATDALSKHGEAVSTPIADWRARTISILA